MKNAKNINFTNKYKQIAKLKNYISLKDVIPNLEVNDKYDEYISLSAEEKQLLFLAYLIEKNELKICTDMELQELYYIIQCFPNLANEYNNSLILLQTLKLIDIEDEQLFESSFDKYANISRKNIATIANNYLVKTKSKR